jgi:hypothetical protein
MLLIKAIRGFRVGGAKTPKHVTRDTRKIRTHMGLRLPIPAGIHALEAQGQQRDSHLVVIYSFGGNFSSPKRRTPVATLHLPPILPGSH